MEALILKRGDDITHRGRRGTVLDVKGPIARVEFHQPNEFGGVAYDSYEQYVVTDQLEKSEPSGDRFRSPRN